MFHPPQYCLGVFERSSDYWVPLLGLFTGARQSELCQLHVGDVYCDQETKVWLIDINDSDDKTLKTPESERRVPIHAQLKRLGFLDFVEDMKAKGSKRLFPDEQRNATGEFSAYSKRFNRYRKRVGVKGDDRQLKDFHSFRHNVSTFLLAKGCEEYVANAKVGHTPTKQSETLKTYSSGPGLKQLDKWVQKIKFDVDFGLIKPNRWKRKLEANGPAT
jgi:integrase